MEIEIQSGNCVITSHELFLCCCEYGYRITVEVCLNDFSIPNMGETDSSETQISIILCGITVEDYGRDTSGLTHIFFLAVQDLNLTVMSCIVG